MGGRLRVGVVLACAIAVAPVTAQHRAVDADAERMATRLAAIIARGDEPPLPGRPPLRTALPEREVNAYFAVRGPEFLPEGLTDPRLTLDTGGRMSARAIVDLDVALGSAERSAFDPLAWVGGDVEVTARGTLQVAGGVGRLTLDRVTVAGLVMPVVVLQQLVTYFTRTEDQPRGFRLDEPFEMPAQIDAVQWRPGEATVVQ